MSIEVRAEAERGRKAVISEHQKRPIGGESEFGERLWKVAIETHVVPLSRGPDSSF